MNILFNQITFIVTSSQQSALVSEFLESVLQTVQKQFTYRQYILTDDNVQTTHKYFKVSLFVT